MSVLTLLPLDLSGNALSNRIQNESHTLITVPGKNDRLVVPNHGGFFESNLVVYNASNQVLSKGTDYVLTYLYRELTELTGKAVYGMIVIINPAVSSVIRMDYRAVGHHFGVSTEELATVLDQLETENQPFTWDDIIDLPREYPPDEHTHQFWQLYGAEKILDVMGRVEGSIQGDRSLSYQYDVDYGNAYYAMAEDAQENWLTAVETHRARNDDPHDLTKTQIGLPLVQNYAAASQSEAEDGALNTRYMTPLRTYQAIQVQVIPDLNAHVGDRNNPHQVTAAQAGAYSTDQVDDIAATKLPRNALAYNSALLEGRNYNTLYNEARANLPTSAFVGMVPLERMGTGTPLALNGNNQLVPQILVDGAWVDGWTSFQPYMPAPIKTYYLGFIETYAAALAHISSNYSDVNQYPVGTVMLYSMRYYNRYEGYNASMSYFQVQLSAAVRTAGGWTDLS